MGISEKHEYYYKTVEEAYGKFVQLMKTNAVNTGRPEGAVDLPESIVWTECLSESVNETVSEVDLTDEMKEAIALANRERFDAMIQMVSQFEQKYLQDREINWRVKMTIQKLQDEIDKYYSTIIDFSSDEATEIPRLILTDDELYSALLMLDSEELRNSLPASLSVSTYSTVLKSIQSHNRVLFNSQLTELRLSDFRNLRGYLISKVEISFPYSSYLESLLDGDSPLYTYLISEVAGNDEILLDEHEYIMATLANKDIFEPKNYERYAQHLIKFFFRLFFSAQDLPLILKRKAEEVVKEWNNGLLYNEAIEIAFNDSPVQFRAVEMLTKIRDKWIIDGLRQQLGQKQPDIKEQAAGITEKGTLRLPYPSRIEYKIKDPSQQNAILSGLFNEFGRFLESKDGTLISHDDFLYLFSGRIARPSTYHPPYYWNQAGNKFAALVRLLYFGQEKGFDETILPIADKGKISNKDRKNNRDKEKSSVKWSSRKQGLGKPILQPIEDKIQSIVFEVAGIYLPEVDLTRLNKSKNKTDEKAEY